MKVKKLLKFYFTAERAERLIDNLICKKASSVSFTRSACDCAEEVADLVKKKAEMCAFYFYVSGVLNLFSEEERQTLKKYAFGRTDACDETELRTARRLALKLARRLRGCSEKYSEGIAAAFDLSIIV